MRAIHYILSISFILLLSCSSQDEFKELLKSAKEGSVEAPYFVGERYEKGNSKETNMKEAEYW